MKNNNIFWISYSDLMTSLFFIMLVLFVVTIGYLQFQKQATEKQLKKIEELQTAVKRLPENYFEYQPQYKRFKLRNQIQFDRGLADIKPMYIDYLEKVGQSINDTIQKLSANENYKNFEIKYLVVIEGMASKDPFPDNFKLSYNRAFSIYKLWKNKFQNSILFNPEYCEIQISGSGIDGIREYSGVNEYKNQQILIHIVPKIGKILEK